MLEKLEYKKLRKDKRATIIDVFFIMVVLLGLAIFIAILGYIIPKITTELRASDINNTAAARTALQSSDDMTGRFDNIFLIVLVGLCMGILISGFLIDVHPIFIPIWIFLLGFAIVIAVIFGNVYQTLMTTTELNATAASQTYTTILMNRFVLVVLGIGILSMIITFGKSRLFSSGGGERI